MHTSLGSNIAVPRNVATGDRVFCRQNVNGVCASNAGLGDVETFWATVSKCCYRDVLRRIKKLQSRKPEVSANNATQERHKAGICHLRYRRQSCDMPETTRRLSAKTPCGSTSILSVVWLALGRRIRKGWIPDFENAKIRCSLRILVGRRCPAFGIQSFLGQPSHRLGYCSTRSG